MVSRRPADRCFGRGWAAIVAVAVADSGGVAGDPAPVPPLPADRVVVLEPDMPGAGDLAAAANGQSVACIDAARRAIVAIDPFNPVRRRDLVADAGASPEPIAVGWLPGDVLAAVCRSGDAWSLRTFRVKPGAAVDAAATSQAVPLPGAADARPALAVSRARNWLAIAGQSESAALRGIVAGDGVRLLPAPPAGGRPARGRAVAAAVSPDDELIVFVKPPSGSVSVCFFGPTGRELLRLDTGLRDVHDAACSRGTGELFVLAGDRGAADQPEGLWRLDAVFRDGMQAIRPVHLVPLDAPLAVASVTDRAVGVVHGSGPRRIVRIDPTPEAHPDAGAPAP